MANVKMSDEVIAILKASTVEGDVLKLPAGQLERKLYEAVNKALTAAGGKWKTNLKGHLFDGDPMKKLGIALDTGVVIDEKKARQAFYTPPKLAKYVVDLAEIADGHCILEPSAGDGALLRALPTGNLKCYAVEIDPESADKLPPCAWVHCGDFLLWEGRTSKQPFDRIIMNPPFAGNQDIRHVSHALNFLKPGGILVAVMWPNTERPAFKKMLEGRVYEVYDIEAGAFKESGTDVPTIVVKIWN